jgi:cobyrinic acid a,c-diamide synthase
MDIPRLVIAEERTGYVPVGVILAAALKQRGYRIRLFSSHRDERVIRLLELLTSQRCYHLDLDCLGNVARLRALFQAASGQSDLSLVLSPLGEMGRGDRFVLDDHTLRLVDALESPILPVMGGDTSAFVTAGRSAKVFEALPKGRVISFMFVGVPSPREYQLLDRELGRRCPVMSLGYLPRDFLREMPPMDQLCSSPVPSLAVGLKTLSARLQSMEHQLLWPAFGALATQEPKWREAEMPQELSSRPMVAVLKHHSLSLSSGNAEALLSAMGCSLVPVPVEGGALPDRFDLLLVPHGPAHLGLLELLDNRGLCESLARAFLSRPVLADGGGAMLMGRSILSRGGVMKALSLLPYDSVPFDGEGAMESRVVRALEDGPLLNKGDVALGIRSPWSGFTRARDREGAWQVEYPKGGVEGMDGWSLGKGICSSLRLELWSCVGRVRRWLS